jgi:hypothetical protein
MSAVLLISAGLIALPASVLSMLGLFEKIAKIVSDLSPPAMFLTGISCISAGLAIMLAVVILFPKQPYLFRKLRLFRKRNQEKL